MQTQIEQLEKTVAILRMKTFMPPHLHYLCMSGEEEYETLKLFLNSSLWPQAVDPRLICKPADDDKKERAEKILDFLIDMPLESLKFLDFGCGEGHVVRKSVQLVRKSVQQKPAVAVGYDLKPSDKWENSETVTFTDNWTAVKDKGPYNVILLYDVIDHLQIKDTAIEPKDIIDILAEIKKVLTPQGKIYMRAHPWCSRHATHLYHTLNKAYVHLVFTAEELKEMGHVGESISHKIIHPLHQYASWLGSAGLRVIRREVTEESIEPFFSDIPIIAKRIKNNWVNSQDRNLANRIEFPFTQTKMQFIDYVIQI